LRKIVGCLSLSTPVAMTKVNVLLHNLQETSMSHKKRTSNSGHWVPNTDVYVTDDTLVIKVELAGMKREDLELSIEDNRIMISGQRPDNCRTAKCNFLVMEINYGSFECVIEIPKGFDLNHAQAAYQNGFLRVDVPKASPPPSKRAIPISED
jgi:HSP20 family protein